MVLDAGGSPACSEVHIKQTLHFFSFFFSVLENEIRVLHLPGKRSSTELNPHLAH
jgi:hypothetical protein